MTHSITPSQNEALAGLNTAIFFANKSNLLSELQKYVEPAVISRFIEGVGRFCTAAQPAAPGTERSEESLDVVLEKSSIETEPHELVAPPENRQMQISAGVGILEDGSTVDLLFIQATLNEAFQETGNHDFAKSADQMAAITGMTQHSGVFYGNGHEIWSDSTAAHPAKAAA